MLGVQKRGIYVLYYIINRHDNSIAYLTNVSTVGVAILLDAYRAP